MGEAGALSQETVPSFAKQFAKCSESCEHVVHCSTNTVVLAYDSILILQLQFVTWPSFQLEGGPSLLSALIGFV